MPEIDEELREILENYALKVDSQDFQDDNSNLCLKCLIKETNKALVAIKAWVDKNYERRKNG